MGDPVNPIGGSPTAVLLTRHRSMYLLELILQRPTYPTHPSFRRVISRTKFDGIEFTRHVPVTRPPGHHRKRDVQN